MQKRYNRFLSIFVLILFFIPVVAGVGLSPPQLRVENAPIGEKTNVAVLVVSNTGSSDAAYLIFKISCLEKTRQQNLRVICTACNRDVGIQRRDLINETCPFCGASADKLIFYDLPPDDILRNITLSSKNFELEPYKDAMYKTKNKVNATDHADIDIAIDIPDIKEYYGQHWEIRIMATSAKDLEDLEGMVMIYGAETKFLVDTPVLKEEAKASGIGTSVIIILFGIVFFVAGISFVVMKKEKIFAAIRQKGTTGEKQKKPSLLKEGRKIL